MNGSVLAVKLCQMVPRCEQLLASWRSSFYDSGVTQRQDRAPDIQDEPPQGAGGVQSVARALSILELFNDRRLELTTNEIAQLTGLNRGTTYRFCRTLLSLGYLEEVGPSTFRPGVKCISLAQAALGSRAIVQIAMPFLNALRDRVQASVNMAILDGTDIVYIVRLLSSDLVTLRLGVGSRMPAYATSLGRSILAFLPPEETASILDHSEFQPLTPWTLATREAIEADLAETRQNGYAFNDQGIAAGIRGVGAPILDGKGRPIASINVSLSRPVTGREVSRELAPEVVKTAREISARAIEMHVG
jgi:IclR family transcriptional regulator, pca regulon regulatory protein